MSRHRIHDLLQIRIDDAAPAAEPIRAWLLELEECPDTGAPADLRWLGESADDIPPAERAAPTQRTARKTPQGRWECRGSGHDPLPLIQDLLLTRDACLLHACALDLGGRGLVVAGESGSGKTAVALSALRSDSLRFVSDDRVIARSDGRVLAFPSPVALYPAHARLLPAGLRRELCGLRLVRGLLGLAGRLPLGRRLGRQTRGLLVARGGALGAWARSLRTRYVSLPTSRLVPPERRVGQTRPGSCLILDRQAQGRGDAFLVEPMQTAEAAERLLAITYGDPEMGPPLDRYAREGALDARRHRERAAAVIRGFAESQEALLRICVPADCDPGRLQEFVLDLIERCLHGLCG